MSGSGEQGTQPVPGLVETMDRREGPEEPDAAPCERERGTAPGDSLGTVRVRFHNEEPSAEEVEVIVLSPRTLMAPTRFACEVCGKGFQREQNLQLHRRAHAHAHAERKWKCDLCGKRYAADHDWAAHARVCVPREHRCECGAVFSRQDRDSFLKHRAFCDALAPPMDVDTVASALHRLPLPSQADGHGNAGGVSGFRIGGAAHLSLWMPVVRADGGSSGGGGFIRGPFERGDGRRGCADGACTRPELPLRGSLSMPVLQAAARAHAVANKHACERCREFLKTK